MKAFLMVLGVISMSGLMARAQEPANEPAQLVASASGNGFVLRYDGQDICTATITATDPDPAGANNHSPDHSPFQITEDHQLDAQGCLTQTIRIALPAGQSGRLTLTGRVRTSAEGLAAELASSAQQRMPMVRTSVGQSASLRNNAIYDRGGDWVLEGSADHTLITPLSAQEWQFQVRGDQAPQLTFRPRYYQKHKGIRFFEPWKYQVWKKSVCGWCSWWAYRGAITEATVAQIAAVFDQNLREYGYEYIQIDDGFQSAGRGLPSTWLQTNDRFPSGLTGLVNTITSHHLLPGLWLYANFSDEATIQAHPDWFVHNPTGAAHRGPWIDFGLDASNPQALQQITRQVYSTLRRQNWRYIKVDSLRHLLYDAYYPCREYLQARGTTPEDNFRQYLGAIREELGRDTYILSCWGVLPESVGLADACRLGGDGFGPATMMQYNSWNNIVWRNDPDHVDISPEGEELIRPVLVSMAGAQLMLSDTVDAYQDPLKIEGARRSAPILFSLPGQLYDVDPTRSQAVKENRRNENGGGGEGPTDAVQRGPRCEWWLQEIARPFGRWIVLARLDWQDLPETQVEFANLGLDPDQDYVVYEFFSEQLLGIFQGQFPAAAQQAKEVRVYAIRPALDRPQLVSTNRHISQGGVDLDQLHWDAGKLRLSGASTVVASDTYQLTLRVPDGYQLESAQVEAGLTADISGQVPVVRVAWTSPTSRRLTWSLQFSRK